MESDLETLFSNLSVNITKQLTKIEKKEDGIFFTPQSTILRSLEILKPHITDKYKVLEPSCGSCEFIKALNEHNSRLKITGIEYNEKIYDNIKKLKITNVKLIHADFLKYTSSKKYNLIIGNPPYYVMKKKDVPKEYHDYFEGRPNIFILFIVKSLKMLFINGFLSFVLPKNFTNCIYYDKLRKYINENYKIIEIIDSSDDKYLETQQDTILFIIRKQKPDNNSFIINIHNYTIMNTKSNILKLKRLYTNSTSLDKLNFKVSVGNVVWNQCKDILTDDNTKTRLIYSSDIENNNLIKKNYPNPKKKNFIEKEGINEILLIINRGYGVGKYSFNYCVLNVTFNYLLENHIIYIKSKNPTEKKVLLDLYDKITKSLEDKRTMEFIDIYFGNNAINTTELNYILPIYSENP